jgi:hypothetical protein
MAGRCEWCNQDMLEAKTCTGNVIEIDGRTYPPIPAEEDCGDCGVKQDGIHHPGCDIETCPCCGGQRVFCNCPNPRCEKCGQRMEYVGSDDKEDYYECDACGSIEDE